MTPRFLLPLAAAAAVAVAGCGSSKSEVKVSTMPSGPVPQAKEPVSGLVKRMAAVQAAIQAGKCTPVNDFNKQSGFGLFCNAQGKKAYKGFKVIGTEAFAFGNPEMNQRIVNRTVFKRAGEPQDVANAIAFLCSDLASYVTGVELYVAGGVELFVF